MSYLVAVGGGRARWEDETLRLKAVGESVVELVLSFDKVGLTSCVLDCMVVV